MDSFQIGAWNIRGLNTTLELDVVDSFTRRNRVKQHPDIMSVLETRICVDNTGGLSRFEKHWCIDSNIGLARNIRVVLWKEATVEVDVVCKDAQFVHCYVRKRGGQFQGFITFLYASNNVTDRQRAWQCLQDLGGTINSPWLIIGDFNVVL